MLPKIDSIRQMRVKTGATQKKLADMADISASMINQIESGRSQPSYDTAKRIFDALAKLDGESSQHTAGDFCSTEIIKLAPDKTLNDAIKRMHELSISQIPVYRSGEPVGIVSDDGIIRHLSEEKLDPNQTLLSSVMDPTPPIVDHKTPAHLLVPLIRYSKCILVSRDTKIMGIITVSDALKMME